MRGPHPPLRVKQVIVSTLTIWDIVLTYYTTYMTTGERPTPTPPGQQVIVSTLTIWDIVLTYYTTYMTTGERPTPTPPGQQVIVSTLTIWHNSHISISKTGADIAFFWPKLFRFPGEAFRAPVLVPLGQWTRAMQIRLPENVPEFGVFWHPCSQGTIGKATSRKDQMPFSCQKYSWQSYPPKGKVTHPKALQC